MISIVTVNWNAYDFLFLLIESLHLFTETRYELVVIDNSDVRRQINEPHVHQIFMSNNVGHGEGLNQGVDKAYELFPQHPFLMFLDCDCHLLRPSWDLYFLNKMKDFDLIGGRGVPSKPIRPACLFMRKELGVHDWTPTEGFKGNRLTAGGYDVGIRAYYKIMADNHRIGFLDSVKNHYGTLNGEEWRIDGVPLVYHHWHGSHLRERQTDFPNDNLLTDKELLFSKIPWRTP